MAYNISFVFQIAAYDIDGTIITTQSGNVFPKDFNDWKIAFNEVPGKLKQLHNDGYKIVCLTNQAAIGQGSLNVENFKAKVVRIVKKLGVPVQVFISTGKGIYRKPAPGMWNALVGKVL
jgi:bifunctional polynucleotide phosphatase/kinase